MTMLTLDEAREKLNFLRERAMNVMKEAGPEVDFNKVTSFDGSASEKADQFKTLNLEMNGTAVELEHLQTIEAQMKANRAEYMRENTPVNTPPWVATDNQEAYFSKSGSLQKLIENNASFKQMQERKAGTAQIDIPLTDFKALVTVGNASPQANRLGLQTMGAEERTVIDMIGTSQVGGNSLDYYEETTIANAAAVVAEGASKPEATAGFTLRQLPIVKVAHYIPITKEAMDDVPFLETQIRSRLVFGVTRQEEAQVLNGTGAAGPPQLIRGLNNATGIQTQARGTDPTPDAFFRAMQLIRGSAGVAFAEPDGIVIHPTDWTDIALLRAADGTYLYGPPSQEGVQRLWGLPVRQTTAQPAGTGLVGAFAAGAEVMRREGISVTASTEHASFFIENKVALLAESRLGLAIWLPGAFATVTGI